MKLLLLYRPNSEHTSIVESFLRDLERQSSLTDKLETMDPNSREGAATASLYDIVQYPAVLVVDDFGSIMRSWQGEQLPRVDDVAGYLLA